MLDCKCFVIQPYSSEYDKRYNEIYKKAILNANIEPYRVDFDHSVNIPIEAIEDNIKKADFCLADITEDNPNVWFEVGFAFAFKKEVVLICGSKRLKLPFDIQHRKIIYYETSVPSDFERLSKRITTRLYAIGKKRTLILMEKKKRIEGLCNISIGILNMISTKEKIRESSSLLKSTEFSVKILCLLTVLQYPFSAWNIQLQDRPTSASAL